ncbi:MAG: haloacid dehalogenase-like hydrolase [Lachnospiraceae bacterium]|nr:haloacid dehalogenase-like hydrolase [Lachnospiraceae bacterium]
MAKRILDCNASDFISFDKNDLLSAIKKAEGRTILAETIGIMQPLLLDVTNAELAASMGADLILLNMFDVWDPVVNGLPDMGPDFDKKETIRLIKKLTGRPVGINLEPVRADFQAESTMSEGRKATVENGKRAAEMGADLILLTGNPGTGVGNEEITATLTAYKEAFGDKLILAAGKMHAAGILNEAADKIITKEDIKRFVDAGADIILLPAPGTVPGITEQLVTELVAYAHSLGVLTLTAIGTSQEGADTDTIKRIALMAKMTGTDIHHLGDSGYPGITVPENITAYSIAIRGVRHTYRRMAMSIER